MRALLDIFLIVLNLYSYIIIINAIFSWLYLLNVINTNNRAVFIIGQTLNKLTEPILKPIRYWTEDLIGIDISSIISLLLIILIQKIIIMYIYPNVF